MDLTPTPKLDDGPAPTGAAEYDALPAAIRAYLPLREWLWLSDGEKAHLEQSETEPDW
jgi:hypothetical protein